MSARSLARSTPLVRLARFAPEGELYLIAEHLQPTGSVYDRIAAPMLDARRAELGPGAVAVVAGSGSTCLAFAAAAAPLAIELVLVCPASTLPEHLALLAMHRATLVTSDPALGLLGAHERAEEVCVERGGILVYSPGAPVEAESVYEASLGRAVSPGVRRVAGGRAVELLVPRGSGALLRGLARALAAAGVEARSYGTVIPDRALGDTRQDGVVTHGQARRLEPGAYIEVTDVEAYTARAEAARSEGVLVGMSTAGALHAARLRAGSAAASVAVVCAVDAGDRYFSTDRRFGARGGAA